MKFEITILARGEPQDNRIVAVPDDYMNTQPSAVTEEMMEWFTQEPQIIADGASITIVRVADSATADG
jgi:hypothetical protein